MSKITIKSPGGAITDRGWIIIFLITSVLLFFISGWAWWHYVRSNPERIFYSAIENSLRTRGVSRHVEQSAGAQKLDQKVQLNLTANHLVHSKTDIIQEGQVDAKVKTETISTPEAQYVRYTEITTDEKNSKGDNVDFSELVNVWGKAETQPGQSASELYGESVLGVIPIGSLDLEQRQSLLSNIRENNIYDYDENNVERKIENGRPVYVYNITVAPEQYVAMLKEFARAIGITSLETVEPANYRDSTPLEFKVKVDVWSQNFSEIEYNAGVRREALESYGLHASVDEPNDTIPLQELQQKLQEIQTR